MKSLLSILILILSVKSANTQDAGAGISIESITPSSAMLFVKTSRISDFVSSVKSFTEDFSAKKELGEFLETINQVRENTGIDILDDKSLNEAGIDTGRKLGFALFREDGETERMIIFIPVSDEKSFPLKFVEILKNRNRDNPALDIYPAVTPYRNSRIFQIQKDVFTAVAGGYFLLAPTGELVRKSLDLFEDGDGVNPGSLSGDMIYSGYRKLAGEDFSINIFAKKEFLEKAYESVPGKKQGRSRRKMAPIKKERLPFLDSIDFAAAGFAYSGGRIKLSISTNFNMNNPTINSILDTFKTGISGNVLYRKGANYNMFLSIDPAGLNRICSKPAPVCTIYTNSIRQIEEEYGINYNSDFVPNFSGGINVNIDSFNPGRGEENYVIFFPMKDKVKTGLMLDKMRKRLRSKYISQKRFGVSRIGNRSAFWMLDDKKKRRYYISDSRGMYIGSSTELLKWALSASIMDNSPVKSIYSGKLGPPVFFLLGIKKESFLSGLIKMRAGQNRELRKSLNRIGDLYIRGAKVGSFISFDIDLEITGR